MKKKLLITTDCFFPRIDGIAVYLKNLLPFLAKSFDITIVAPKFKGRLPKLPATIIQIPLGGKIADIGIAQWRYKKIKQLVSEHDVVLNHTLGTIGLAALRASKKLKKPIVSYIHSFEWELFSLSVIKFKHLVKWLTKKYVKFAYKSATRLIFPSEQVQKAYEKLKITVPSSIIPVKISVKQFKPRRTKHRVPVIGYCGRLAREKGIIYLLSAFKKIKKQYKIKLLIVGDGLKTLKWRAQLMGAKLTGQVNNPEIYYQKMDIFVLPSLTETTSIATMEAMSSGLPIIATPVGRVTEFIQRSHGGILTPREDANALAQSIEHLITNDSLRKRYAKNARAYALKHFDIKDSAMKLIKVLAKASS